MRIVIAGASGLIGTALTRRLEARGDEVVRLVRREPEAAGEARWDPAAGTLDPAVLAGASAVVNLAGFPISRLPWTGRRRREILDSRLAATGTIVAALRTVAAASGEPPALVNASAVGYYGSRPGETLVESSAPGSGFLAGVVREWEAAAREAEPFTRVVLARTGIVIADGGALGPLRRLAQLGLGGPLGRGRQLWPWISLRDEARAFAFLVDAPIAGAVNLAGPTPATEREVVTALVRSMRRPLGANAPASALTLLLGDAARELLLADQHVEPRALLDAGFEFRDRTVEEAIAALGER